MSMTSLGSNDSTKTSEKHLQHGSQNEQKGKAVKIGISISYLQSYSHKKTNSLVKHNATVEIVTVQNLIYWLTGRKHFVQWNCVSPHIQSCVFHVYNVLLYFYFKTVFQSAFNFVFWSSSLVLLRSSSNQVILIFFLTILAPFMFLTAGHRTTPFLCFAAPESSSHPPARNRLCTHPTDRASAGHRGRDEETVSDSYPKWTRFCSTRTSKQPCYPTCISNHWSVL